MQGTRRIDVGLTAKMVTFDCADARALARFWADATGGEVAQDFEGWFVVVATPALGIGALGFQRVPETKAAKNRCHLDLVTDDRPGEVARLVGLGARQGQEHSAGPLTWTRMEDPEGNEFCVALDLEASE